MIAIQPIPPAERAALVPLLDAYMAEMRPVLAGHRGASGAEAAALLAADPRAEVLLARRDGVAAGFAVFFDLPEIVFARRCGALDDLFVHPASRGQGVARALLAALTEEGRARHWSHLRWIVPEGDAAAITLYERMAQRAPWRSYVLRLDPDASL
ncbi:GNAT family N-acetyltransferase [Roseomonas sp. BN140053]|uniref:GNAT family N-acetyltransferase n=1 Tax=Roseomonas sp. BN140053 TaxID=3391898 RepID=UPI0039ECF295